MRLFLGYQRWIVQVSVGLIAVLALCDLTSGRSAPENALYDFEAEVDTALIRGQDAEFAQVAVGDTKTLELRFSGSGDYPAIHFNLPKDQQDLSRGAGVEALVRNTSDRALRVHLRADNEGDWRRKPWSINAKHIKPGESVNIRVPFGTSYGNPGFDLDTSKVIRVVLFIERPKRPATLQVQRVSLYTPADQGSGGSSGASSAQTEVVVPATHVLHDFTNPEDARLYADNEAVHQLVDVEGKRVMQLRFPNKAQYPGVQLNAPAGGWDLRNRAGIEVDISNPGERAVTVALRIDNPGDWQSNPWNAEKTHLRPGQKATLRVTFGQSWGGPGYAINPARIVRALVYAERPAEGAIVNVHELRSWGHASPREVDTVDLQGVLFDFGTDFIPTGRVGEKGGTARFERQTMIVTYEPTEKWPAVVLKPIGKRWDLSNFESVQADLTNVGDDPVRVGLRVDNSGSPDSSNTELVDLAPKESKTITVNFGRSWGKPGYRLDPAAVTSLLLFADQPQVRAEVAVRNIKANRKQWAEVPDWIGTKPPVEGDWILTLDENFDSDSLDTRTWTPRLVWDGPAASETQRYIEENVVVADGKMILQCEVNPGHQYNDPKLGHRKYATAAVTTLGKWTQRYGYFEARIKPPTARGLWPAFWLMPDRGEASGLDIWNRRATERDGMEIDIWEHLTEWGPGRYNIATHWDGYGSNHKHWGNSHIYHLPTPDGWHHVGVLWEPGKLTWFCDGKQVGKWENDRIATVPMYIKFTVQMGNWATKDVDESALPDSFQIDYVRVWQLRERMSDQQYSAAMAQDSDMVEPIGGGVRRYPLDR